MGKLFSTNRVKKTRYPYTKNEGGPLLYTTHTHTHIHTHKCSNWTKGLNLGTKTINPLEETGRNLYDFGFGNSLLDKTTKAEKKKRKHTQR